MFPFADKRRRHCGKGGEGGGEEGRGGSKGKTQLLVRCLQLLSNLVVSRDTIVSPEGTFLTEDVLKMKRSILDISFTLHEL